MWLYDIKNNTYEQVKQNGEDKPNWKDPKTLTAVIINDKMYVMSGSKESSNAGLKDFLSFDMKTHTWSSLNDESSPEARGWH